MRQKLAARLHFLPVNFSDVRNFVRPLKRLFFSRSDPIIWPLVSLVCTVISAWALSRNPSSWITLVLADLLGISSAAVAVGALLIAFPMNVIYYSVNQKLLGRLILLYISIMLIFANLYFFVVVRTENPVVNVRAFEGIHSPWGTVKAGVEVRDRLGNLIYTQPDDKAGITLEDALLTVVDCFHFSTVTITTVGYGDMRPVTWYAKLLVDSEIFLGLGVVALGIGRYFAYWSSAGSSK
jgi:hypothetical protein